MIQLSPRAAGRSVVRQWPDHALAACEHQANAAGPARGAGGCRGRCSLGAVFSGGDRLVGGDEHYAAVTLSTSCDYHALIDEAGQPFLALYPLAFRHQEESPTTRAGDRFLTLRPAVRSGEAPNALLYVTLAAVPEDDPPEVVPHGPGVVLDGHSEGHDATGIAGQRSEPVQCVRKTVGVERPAGERFHCFQNLRSRHHIVLGHLLEAIASDAKVQGTSSGSTR